MIFFYLLTLFESALWLFWRKCKHFVIVVRICWQNYWSLLHWLILWSRACLTAHRLEEKAGRVSWIQIASDCRCHPLTVKFVGKDDLVVVASCSYRCLRPSCQLHWLLPIYKAVILLLSWRDACGTIVSLSVSEAASSASTSISSSWSTCDTRTHLLWGVVIHEIPRRANSLCVRHHRARLLVNHLIVSHKWVNKARELLLLLTARLLRSRWCCVAATSKLAASIAEQLDATPNF